MRGIASTIVQVEGFNISHRNKIDDNFNEGESSGATYTGVHLLHRRLQSVGGVPAFSARLALPVTDLADGIGHVLEDFGELFRI